MASNRKVGFVVSLLIPVIGSIVIRITYEYPGMKRYPLAILLLVVVVLSAGCASLIPGEDSSSTPATNQSDSNETATDNPEQPETSTPEANQTSTPETNNTSPTYPAWSQPTPPNYPLENKIEPERIPDVQTVNTESGSNDEGYVNFDLQVTADTRMENIDPPEHGTVAGEPYFIVYVSETRFTQINSSQMRETRFARMDNLPMRENGTFTITMKKRGLEEFEGGQLNIKVRLFDEDSEWDDIYGEWTGTLEYNPE